MKTFEYIYLNSHWHDACETNILLYSSNRFYTSDPRNSNFIVDSFSWDLTKEGDEFWFRVYQLMQLIRKNRVML